MEKKQKPYVNTVFDDEIGLIFIFKSFVHVSDRYCQLQYEGTRDSIIRMIRRAHIKNLQNSINYKLN